MTNYRILADLGPFAEFEESGESPTGQDLKRLYSQGGVTVDGHMERVVGSKRDPKKFQDFTSYLTKRQGTYLFGSLALDLEGSGRGKISLPFKAAVSLDPEFGGYEAQTTGDCVSHSTRNAGMLDYCVDVLRGETDYKGRFATENIYGYRGHGGQGASCSRLADYVAPDGPGGFLVRKKYSSVDLSVYNSRIGHNWGRRGTPDSVNKEADDNKAQTIALVTNTDEACDAIANGYGISVCSDHGFNGDRGRFGVAQRRGSWSHAMAWVGCIDDPDNEAYRHYDGRLFLVQNSWGSNWQGGPTYMDQPPGSFWITERTAQQMINARGSWVISRVDGINRRDLSYVLI
tara:strand:- start:552 stop:1586 length:1035 start_codon:yes stop_codon:yes gene_type:complete